MPEKYKDCAGEYILPFPPPTGGGKEFSPGKRIQEKMCTQKEEKGKKGKKKRKKGEKKRKKGEKKRKKGRKKEKREGGKEKREEKRK